MPFINKVNLFFFFSLAKFMAILKKRVVVVVVINFILSSHKEKAVLFHVRYLSHFFF